MPKKTNDVTQRAWNLLRLGLLWARKGGVFKRRLMTELRVVPKFVKRLGHATSTRRDRLHYGERELSFDKTPIFNVKMHRPASMRYLLIPCITPTQQVDFDYDFDDDGDTEDGVYGYDYDNSGSGKKSFLKDNEERARYAYGYEANEEIILPEEEGIDLRAEEFIVNFYQQIKMQRQISYLEYNERLTNS